jgi:hypothetical protein
MVDFYLKTCVSFWHTSIKVYYFATKVICITFKLICQLLLNPPL